MCRFVNVVCSTFHSIIELRDQVWDLVDDFLAPRPSQPTLLSDGAISLAAKQSAGFNISFNDYFGRSLSYHLINDTPHNPSGPGSATLWHSIRSTSKFMDHSAPFPIVIALGREQGQTNVTLTSPIVSPSRPIVMWGLRLLLTDWLMNSIIYIM